MATDVAYGLPRLQSPCLLAVVHLRHVNLRMAYGTGDAVLHALLLTRQAGYEGALRVVVERAAQRVAHLVAEGRDAGCLTHVGFHGELFHRIGARACAPSLAVDERCGEGKVEHAAYFVHCLDVVHAHQVYTEAVDVVLVNPVAHGLKHEVAHRVKLAGGLIAASRTVRPLAVGRLAIENVGISALEIAALDVESVVVNHVEDYADAGLVQGAHHLLELFYAHRGVVRIGGIRTFGHVVVQRVVAPVVLRRVQLSLVYRRIVV